MAPAAATTATSTAAAPGHGASRRVTPAPATETSASRPVHAAAAAGWSPRARARLEDVWPTLAATYKVVIFNGAFKICQLYSSPYAQGVTVMLTVCGRVKAWLVTRQIVCVVLGRIESHRSAISVAPPWSMHLQTTKIYPEATNQSNGPYHCGFALATNVQHLQTVPHCQRPAVIPSLSSQCSILTNAPLSELRRPSLGQRTGSAAIQPTWGCSLGRTMFPGPLLHLMPMFGPSRLKKRR